MAARGIRSRSATALGIARRAANTRLKLTVRALYIGAHSRRRAARGPQLKRISLEHS
jgi:hypothetical protein